MSSSFYKTREKIRKSHTLGPKESIGILQKKPLVGSPATRSRWGQNKRSKASSPLSKLHCNHVQRLAPLVCRHHNRSPAVPCRRLLVGRFDIFVGQWDQSNKQCTSFCQLRLQLQKKLGKKSLCQLVGFYPQFRSDVTPTNLDNARCFFPRKSIKSTMPLPLFWMQFPGVSPITTRVICKNTLYSGVKSHICWPQKTNSPMFFPWHRTSILIFFIEVGM